MSVVVEALTLSSTAAAQMCQAAVAHAQSLGVKINVAVVDNGGNLLAFQRMNGAFLHSISIAEDKAYCAVSFTMPTGAWQSVFDEMPRLKDGLIHRPRFVTLAGGLTIEHQGQVVGGIGVSGASEEQDEACAAAALAVLESA